MKIERVPAMSSKEDELNALNKVVCLFSPGTYLHKLFSEQFISWVCQKVREDIEPDMHGYLLQLQDALYKAEQATAQYQADMVIQHDNHQHALTQLRADMQHEIDVLQGSYDYINRLCAEYRIKTSDLANELANVNSVNISLMAECDVRGDQIVALKAKLWDLTNKKG